MVLEELFSQLSLNGDFFLLKSPFPSIFSYIFMCGSVSALGKRIRIHKAPRIWIRNTAHGTVLPKTKKLRIFSFSPISTAEDDAWLAVINGGNSAVPTRGEEELAATEVRRTEGQPAEYDYVDQAPQAALPPPPPPPPVRPRQPPPPQRSPPPPQGGPQAFLGGSRRAGGPPPPPQPAKQQGGTFYFNNKYPKYIDTVRYRKVHKYCSFSQIKGLQDHLPPPEPLQYLVGSVPSFRHPFGFGSRFNILFVV